jgi:phosphonate transport system permease protein
MQDTLSRRTARLAVPKIARPSYFNKKTLWLGLFVVAVIWSLYQAGLFQGELINTGGWTLVARFGQASVNPELSGDFLQLTVRATLVTLAFAVCGIFLSLIFGFASGILASEVWWTAIVPPQRQHLFRGPWLAFRSGLASLRAIHEIVWGLIFVNIFGLDPLTAILAIAVPFGAVTAKVYSEILDETPRDAFTALRNSGVAAPKAFAYTLLPQASLDWLSYGFYRFECAIRAAAVLGIIGAGGLGHEIFLSFQTLKYAQIWTLFYALFLLNGVADFWSSLLRRRLGGQISCTGRNCLDSAVIASSTPSNERIYRRDPVMRWSILIALILIPFSFWYVQPDFSRLFSARTGQNLMELLQFSLPPDFAVVTWWQWLELAQTTLAMSLLAVTGAGLVGLCLSFPAAANFLLPGGLMDLGRGGKLRAVWGVTILVATRAFLLVSRSIPPPIWALMFLFVLFPGVLPGAAALGIYTVGVLGRLMAEVTENLDDRPLTALKAQGAASGQVFMYGVLPATTPRFIAYFLYRWEEIIRATVVIGLVGAGGLGWLLVERLSAFDYQGVLASLIIFIGIIFVVDLISAAVRRVFRES